MADADQARASAQQLATQQLLGRPVEGAGGLIKHHEAGRTKQQAGKRQALLLT